MNKVICSMVLLIATASMAFAQDAAMKSAAPMGAMVANSAAKVLVGTVKAVSLADVAKGVKSEVTVSDTSGATTSILVQTTTTLYDADAKAIMLDKIAVGNKVTVAYVTSPEGLNKAQSIKITK